MLYTLGSEPWAQYMRSDSYVLRLARQSTYICAKQTMHYKHKQQDWNPTCSG